MGFLEKWVLGPVHINRPSHSAPGSQTWQDWRKLWFTFSSTLLSPAPGARPRSAASPCTPVSLSPGASHLPSLGLPFVSSFEETRKWRKWRDQWPALSHAGSPLSSQSLTLPETPRPQLWKCSDSKWQNSSMKGLCMAVVMILKMSVWKLAVSVMPHSSIWYDSHPRKLQTPFPNFFWEFIRPP